MTDRCCTVLQIVPEGLFTTTDAALVHQLGMKRVNIDSTVQIIGKISRMRKLWLQSCDELQITHNSAVLTSSLALYEHLVKMRHFYLDFATMQYPAIRAGLPSLLSQNYMDGIALGVPLGGSEDEDVEEPPPRRVRQCVNPPS